MTIVIFSDTHLTDIFEDSKFRCLARIIERADRVIINGDFWDRYLTTFDKFVRSEWRKLFPLLKKKKTVYLYGNHDKRQYRDSRVNYFSEKQTDIYKLSVGRSILHVEHGDRIAPAEDTWLPRFFFQPIFLKPYIFYREYLPLKMFGPRILVKYKKQNDKLKSWFKANLPQNNILVTGHSHLPEFNLKKGFINLGLIRHGFAYYLLIKNKQLELIGENYENTTSPWR
jgi:predicted phosphodiesterase